MITIWITYCVAAVVASGIFVVAGWRSKKAAGLAVAETDRPPSDALGGSIGIGSDSSLSPNDVALSLQIALKRLSPLLRSKAVRPELAVPPGLLVRMRGQPLADLLEELISAAIHAAPASRLLIAAAARRERVYISVTDDMPGADAVLRAAQVRGLMERVAMRGGALDVDVRPAEGTIMTLRLAVAPKQFTTILPVSSATSAKDELKLISSIGA